MLWHDDFQFVAFFLCDGRMGFRADTYPIDGEGDGACAIGFDGNMAMVLMEAMDEGGVQLEAWFASCEDDKGACVWRVRCLWTIGVMVPAIEECARKAFTAGECSSPWPISAHKLGIAPSAYGALSVFFHARP